MKAKDPKPYARNQAQKAQWERDRRVEVTLRPLKYSYQRDLDGQIATDTDGRKLVSGKAEKGVDVLCALALVREARREDVDLVILASQDSDLEPPLNEALGLQSAKVETFTWTDPSRRTRQLRPSSGPQTLEHAPWGSRLPAMHRPDDLPVSTQHVGPGGA